MKSLITVTSIILLLTTLSFSQSGTIVYDSFYSPSLSKSIPLAIYLPPNHSPTAEPYRAYIFLHGGSGNTYTSNLGAISSALDTLINDPSLDFQPMVAICPGITWQGLGGGVNWLNLHWYGDSYLTGNYESVISEDLFNWMDTCSYNLSTLREKRAIGGFSMGGVGCELISIKHSTKVIAFTSHCGGGDLSYWIEVTPDYIRSEAPAPKPPYHFDPHNGFWTLEWFALSAWLSPDTLNPNQPAWQVDFPMDSLTGDSIPEILDSLWMPNADAVTIMMNPQLYTDSVHIYFDTRIADPNKSGNDRLHFRLDTLGIQHAYHIFPTGGHQYSVDQAEKGFMFLDSIMDDVVTSVPKQKIHSVKQFKLYQNYPNPFNPQTKIEITLAQSNHVVLEIYNLLGQKIETLVSDRLSAGSHKYEWDASNYPSGVYIYRLKAGEFAEIKKMILLK